MDAKAAGMTTDSSDREIVLSRVYDAPRELVWEVWTDPRHVVHWWGPDGFTTTIETMDVRVGGVWRHVMHGPDGTDYANESVFTEVMKPERIAYSHGGRRAGGPEVAFVATWVFDALDDDSTRVTMRLVFESKAARDLVAREYGAIEGGKQTLGRLDTYVHQQQGEFVIARDFPVARELMWQVWTDPAHMQHWWGPKGFKVFHNEMDVRPGGTYHYGIRSPEGLEIWGKFFYRELAAPEYLTFVTCFSDADGNITRHPLSPTWPLHMLTTITFEPTENGTRVKIRWKPLDATDEERQTFEAAYDSMNNGWGGTFEQLRTYLGTGSNPG